MIRLWDTTSEGHLAYLWEEEMTWGHFLEKVISGPELDSRVSGEQS